MPSLQDQLKEIEKEENSHKAVFDRFKDFNSALDKVGLISAILSICSIICLLIIIYSRVETKNRYYGFEIFETIWLSFIAYAILLVFFKLLVAALIRLYYRFGNKQTQNVTELQKVFQNRKKATQKLIEEENRKIFREREQKFIERVDLILELAERKKISPEIILQEKKKLQLEDSEIENFGYQIHTKGFYTDRFTKIDQALNLILLGPDITDYKNIPTIKKDLVNREKIDDKPEINNNSTPGDKPIGVSPFVFSEKDIEEMLSESSIAESITNKVGRSPKEVEKTVSELFGEPKQKILDDESVKHPQKRSPAKIDFSKLNQHRLNIGELGELYIFEKEQLHFLNQGKHWEAVGVSHISRRSDSEGYDILSFTDDRQRKYIEVKTTTGNQFEPFYLSNCEMEAMKKLKNYWIYRVYNFNIDLKKGDLCKIDCGKELLTYCQIEASSFKVSPRK